jgi:hypothetical protein
VTETAPLHVRLLTAAAPTASADALVALARGLGQTLVRRDTGVRMVLSLLCERGEDGVPALRELLPHLSAVDEAWLASYHALPGRIAELLAGSKRKRTVRALTAQRDLPTTVIERLARHPIYEVRRGVLDTPSTPTRLRISAFEADPNRNTELWCLTDPEFCAYYFRQQLERVRAERPGSTNLLTLRGMPHRDLDPELLSLLLAIVRGAIARNCPDIIAFYLKGEPDVLTTRAIFAVLVEHPDILALLDGPIVATYSRPVTPPGVCLDELVPDRWGVQGTLGDAWHLGGYCREAALRHPGLDPDLRNRSVFSDSPSEWCAVAHNPALTVDEVDRLLEVLNPDDRWRLATAHLTDSQRRRILDGGPGLVQLLLAAWPWAREDLPQLEQWTTPEMYRHMLAHRGECVDRNDTPGVFARFADRVVTEHHDLAGDVAAALTRRDVLSPAVAEAILPHILGRLDPTAVETFCALLPEWSGSLVDLAAAAALLHAAAGPAAQPATQVG